MNKRTKFLLGIAVIATLVIGWQIAAFAGPVGISSGFEDDDGNLAPNNQPGVLGDDWNSFNPPDWVGTLANYQTSDETDLPDWDFFGMQDEFKGSGNNNADSIYAGGTKQSDNCPTLVTKSAPNKDDMKRVYFATKTLANGDLVLNLAFVRIPLNSTQSSAHLSFEFNQSDTPCATPGNHTDPAGRSLVPRTGDGPAGPLVDDLLIQYDFEGGTATPVISLSRWTGSTWTNPVALPVGVAEAAINQVALTGPTNGDRLAPPGPDTPEDLGRLEFGEAGINLTAAGVFSEGDCVQFGRVSASSRSSGNSNTSNMFDIVGPDEFSLENCGGIIIRKETVPDEDPNSTQFDYTTTGGLDPATFDLTDDESQDFGTEVQEGSYSVTEDLTQAGLDNYTLTDLDCSASDLTNGSTVTVGRTDPNDPTSPLNGTVDISLEAQDQIDCTYTNTLQQGALAIVKNSTKGGLVSAGGAVFSFDGGSVTDQDTTGDPNTGAVPDEDPDIGEVCVSGLDLGDYAVTETSAPPGYGLPTDPGPETVTVVNNTDCTAANYPTGAAVVTFTDPPLSDIQVRFRDGGSGETVLTGAGISCDNATGTTDNDDTTGWDDTETVSGVRLDPSPQTITCTIEIDP